MTDRNIAFAAKQMLLREHQERIREAAKRWDAVLAADYQQRVLTQVIQAEYPTGGRKVRIYPVADVQQL